MAKQILTDLNLKGNELQKAAIENATAAPLNPSTGQIYYDTNLGKTKLFNGTTWTDDDKVYVGTIEPTDPGKTVWIDPSATEISAEDVIFEDDENLEDEISSVNLCNVTMVGTFFIKLGANRNNIFKSIIFITIVIFS